MERAGKIFLTRSECGDTQFPNFLFMHRRRVALVYFRKLTSKEHVFPERFPCADMKQTARLAARLDQKQIDMLCRARSPLSHEMQTYTAWSTNFIHTI